MDDADALLVALAVFWAIWGLVVVGCVDWRCWKWLKRRRKVTVTFYGSLADGLRVKFDAKPPPKVGLRFTGPDSGEKFTVMYVLTPKGFQYRGEWYRDHLKGPDYGDLKTTVWALGEGETPEEKELVRVWELKETPKGGG